MDAYLILGTRGSCRRAVVADIIARAVEDEIPVCAMMSSSEKTSDADARLNELADVIKYDSADDALDKARAADGASEICFFFADPVVSLAESIESFKRIADTGALRLVRIFGVVDCALYVANFGEASAYYDAVSHFSDCVILANRTGVEGKDVDAIKKRYRQMYRPHTFQFAMKDGKVEAPVELLIDEARRMSIYFDDYDPIDELELDEDTLPDEPFTIERKVDPYLEYDDRGNRVLTIPNVDELIAKM